MLCIQFCSFAKPLLLEMEYRPAIGLQGNKKYMNENARQDLYDTLE